MDEAVHEFVIIKQIIQEKYVSIAKPPQKTDCPSDLPYKSVSREVLAIEMYYSWMICVYVILKTQDVHKVLAETRQIQKLASVFVRQRCYRWYEASS